MKKILCLLFVADSQTIDEDGLSPADDNKNVNIEYFVENNSHEGITTDSDDDSDDDSGYVQSPLNEIELMENFHGCTIS